ncbi:hypothetical protein C8J56DRAFT_915580 [Mycena floridula]|nr:hypothetical protein C8J56DRAFT_915580 [Mycena floridula]
MVSRPFSSLQPEELLAIYETPFWGVLVSIAMMGITIMQAFRYFNTKYDAWFFRLFVAIVIALDFGNVALDAAVLRYYLIENYGNPSAFLALSSYLSLESMMTAIIVFLVHLFFASRVYQLTARNWYITGFILMTATCALVAGLLKSVATLHDSNVDHLSSKAMVIEVVLRALSAALCDVTVTVVLYRALRESQSGTATRSRRNNIQTLLNFIMTRGVLVTVTQLTLLILYAFDAQKMYWSTIHFTLTRFYVISLVSMLNARKEFKQFQRSSDESYELDVSNAMTTYLSSMNPTRNSNVSVATGDLQGLSGAGIVPPKLESASGSGSQEKETV